MRGKTMHRTSLFIALISSLALVTCQSMKEKTAKRMEQKRTRVEQGLSALQWVLPLVEQAPRDKIQSCDDATLPRRLQRSARFCQRLPAAHISHIRVLTGTDNLATEQWQWMRKRALADLAPLTQESRNNDLSKYSRALKELHESYLAIFTESTATDKNQYQGALLIFDVAKKTLRCSMPVKQSVEKIITPPKNAKGIRGSSHPYKEEFFRQLNREIKEKLSEHLCIE